MAGPPLFAAPNLPDGIPWPPETAAWWQKLASGAARSQDDWEFCVETALVHAEVWSGNTARAKELRTRLDRVNRQSLPKNPPGRRWTAAEDRDLVKLHARGLSLHAIAREMGRPKSVVSTHAKELSLEWDREGTAAATKAVQVDNRARRTVIISRMYDRIDHLQDRLDAPTFRTVLRGVDGDAPTDVDFVPTVDERNVADTISRYAVTASRLEAVDSGVTAEGVRNLLSGISRQIGLHDDTDQTAPDADPT